MAKQMIPWNGTSEIWLEVDGDLSVTGWDQSEISVEIEDLGDLTHTEENGAIKIQCDDDAVVSLPAAAQITVSKVEGDCMAQGLTGEVHFQRVDGDLNARNLSVCRAGQVAGNCKIVHVTSRLVVDMAGGNLKAKDIAGELAANSVGGNIKIENISGPVTMANAGGNVKLFMSSLEGVKAQAGGNIKLFVPPGAGFELEAASGGEKIVVSQGEKVHKMMVGVHRVTVGQGGPLISLSAGGNIQVLDTIAGEDLEPFDTSAFDQRIQEKISRIRNRVENSTRSWDKEWADEWAGEAGRMIENRVQAAMRKIGRFDLDAIKVDLSGLSNIPVPPVPPVPPVQPITSRAGKEKTSRVSDMERQLVLQMLAEKKITAEEANRLFEALEGSAE